MRIDAWSILEHAVHGVSCAALASDAQIVVVAPAEQLDSAHAVERRRAGARSDRLTVVAGGSSRQASVAAGLAALRPDVQTVLIHDAARALTPPEVFDRVAAAVKAGAVGVIPVLPVVDTLKKVSGATVVDAVDRTEFAAAQTPQGFRRDALDAGYRVALSQMPVAEYTDDAALMAAAGHHIRTVPGSTEAFKITTGTDLERARLMLAPPAEQTRVGVGTDVHGFGGDGPLWLAGLEWPDEPALSGHSDGDAVAHAIVDALLSAAGLGDIGTHFGTDRPEYRGAHADAFLSETVRLIAEQGWRVGNVSVQLQSARPRFAPRREEAEAALSAALGGAPVSVSATTTDGLGFVGRGEGVSVYAVAQLIRSACRD